MKNFSKSIYKIPLCYRFRSFLKEYYKYFKGLDLFCRRCRISGSKKIILKKNIQGYGHELLIGEGSCLDHVSLRIRGTKNKIIIGKSCYIGPGCEFLLEGNNITVSILEGCTFTHDDQLCAQEDNSSITIGSDCMFSHHINVRTSDSHFIYSRDTQQRLNPPESVIIGNHVWIAPEVKIMKGVKIGNNSVVGSNSIVTKEIPENSLAVGIPAKIVKSDIDWSRKAVF